MEDMTGSGSPCYQLSVHRIEHLARKCKFIDRLSARSSRNFSKSVRLRSSTLRSLEQPRAGRGRPMSSTWLSGPFSSAAPGARDLTCWTSPDGICDASGWARAASECSPTEPSASILRRLHCQIHIRLFTRIRFWSRPEMDTMQLKRKLPHRRIPFPALPPQRGFYERRFAGAGLLRKGSYTAISD